MKSRGQDNFINLPSFAARLYNNLAKTKAIECQHQEIARDLVSRIEHGKLLDIGTGPGILLYEIHRLNPRIELFGLDISKAMVQLARNNLKNIDVNILRGNIQNTNYNDNFFDLVTCTGSFYLWDNPKDCLEEICRIMLKNRSAYLYETYQDFNTSQVRKAVKDNLKDETLARRLVTPVFLMRQLRMTYKTEEVAGIINQTSFADSYTIDRISLGGLPAWLRIQLKKGE
jgi:ubiquinone/menaquinone biosynthesis C-methylase UbiE